jgi:lysophospholipase L1-like esterase
VPCAQTLSNARAIFSAAAAYAPALMIGPAPIAEADVNARVQELIPALGAACQELRVPFLDVFDRLRSSSAWMQEITRGDGAHPGRQGYEAFTALVNDWTGWQASLGRGEFNL